MFLYIRFSRFLCQRAEEFVILRRAPVKVKMERKNSTTRNIHIQPSQLQLCDSTF